MTTANHMCVYADCFKNNKRDKDISFFKFPVKDEGRTKTWMSNCGNVNIIKMDIHDLKNKLICEEHFTAKDFIINKKRKLLRKTAVPIIYTVIKIEDHIDIGPTVVTSYAASNAHETYERKRILNDTDDLIKQENKCESQDVPSSSANCSIIPNMSEHIVQIPSPNADILKLRNKKLSYRIIKLSRKDKPLYLQYRKTIKKRSLVNSIVQGLLSLKSDPVKTFVHMQCFHDPRTLWSASEKQLAMSLYNKSASCYEFMRNDLKFCLPSIRIIQIWLKEDKLSTGTNAVFIKKRKLSASTDQ